MNHADHVQLLKKAAIGSNEVWADLGSGDGAFTLALRDLGGETITIYSVDKDRARLEQQQKNFDQQFPQSIIHYLEKDFTEPLDLPPLDGIIMANSLHFVKDKLPLLKQLKRHLKKDGQFILIEYNADDSNSWVPYPISFSSWQQLAIQAGFSEPQLLYSVPSDFMNAIYSAVSRDTISD